MKLASEFSVPAAPDKVFSLFFDPDTMRGCIPGCQRLERVDETTYRGTLVNEIAHVRFSAGFSAAIQSVSDEAETKEVTAVLKGEDRRLGSSIKIDARLAVRPDGDDSVIGYEMDMALWGKLGRLGEPIIRRRSREVEQEFARSLAIACGAPEEGLPARRTRPAGTRKVVPAARPARTTRATGAEVPTNGSGAASARGASGGAVPASGGVVSAGAGSGGVAPAGGAAASAGGVVAPITNAVASVSGVPAVEVADPTGRRLAVAALLTSLAALLVAVLRRGR